MQHPRIFGQGHTGQGWTNIAPMILYTSKKYYRLRGKHAKLSSQGTAKEELSVCAFDPFVHCTL
jgi:hypothetical protein